MAIKYIKKALKTPSSDEVETRQRVQEILQQIENTREEGIKEISRKFDKYEGDIILSQDKIDDDQQSPIIPSQCQSRTVRTTSFWDASTFFEDDLTILFLIVHRLY